MPVLVVPDPSLVILVGAAGAGKSTLSARHFAPDDVLSSDALREWVSGDAADQRASAAAFRILHLELEHRLQTGRLTVVDATNTQPGHRRPLVARARAAGLPAAAIVVHLPADVVHRRNGRRERVVDPAVVDRHLVAVARTVERDDLATEGFAPVLVLRSVADVDDLVIVRRSTRGT